MEVFYDKTGWKLPIKIWADDIDANCLEQAEEVASLPYLRKWVALMPDTHLGAGMPIGGVIASDGVVIPNAVGSDIGCGMSFAIVDYKASEVTKEEIKAILREIKHSVPLGKSMHKNPIEFAEKINSFSGIENALIFNRQYNVIQRQLKTLGSGNHFIELQEVVTGEDELKDFTGNLAIMLHTGSRRYGNKVNSYYHNIAKDRALRFWGVKIGDLAGLPVDSDGGKKYLTEMNIALAFAKLNRELILNEVYTALDSVLGAKLIRFGLYAIDVHHNYASLENHYNKNYWIHRKGAISAKEGEVGIIPSSMGTESYIVKGKGNRESFYSASHGSGRLMSRRDARNQCDVDTFKAMLDKQGVQLIGASFKDCLDENPTAYKDGKLVMQNQKDLVDVIATLKPLGVIKGG